MGWLGCALSNPGPIFTWNSGGWRLPSRSAPGASEGVSGTENADPHPLPPAPGLGPAWRAFWKRARGRWERVRWGGGGASLHGGFWKNPTPSQRSAPSPRAGHLSLLTLFPKEVRTGLEPSRGRAGRREAAVPVRVSGTRAAPGTLPRALRNPGPRAFPTGGAGRAGARAAFPGLHPAARPRPAARSAGRRVPWRAGTSTAPPPGALGPLPAPRGSGLVPNLFSAVN